MDDQRSMLDIMSQKIIFGSPEKKSKITSLVQTESQGSLRSSIETSKDGSQNGDEDHPPEEPKVGIMASGFSGMFFEQAFKSDLNRNQKQLQCLYHQIGISSPQPTEEELEDAIIIKAMTDFNTSKFCRDDHTVIVSMIRDVFCESDNKLLTHSSEMELANKTADKMVQGAHDYGNLRELIAQFFIANKLEYNEELEQKCYQMFEVLQAKTGCILLGETGSCKSTIIEVLAGALNEASLNELKLRVGQVRRERLIKMILSCPSINLLLPSLQVKKLSEQIKEAQA